MSSVLERDVAMPSAAAQLHGVSLPPSSSRDAQELRVTGKGACEIVWRDRCAVMTNLASYVVCASSAVRGRDSRVDRMHWESQA